MRRISQLLRVFATVLAVALLAPATLAQDLPDADTREVGAYTLTEAAFGKYLQATRNLSGIKIENCDDSDVKSLADAAAKLDAAPGAKVAVQSAGMTSREYVVFAFSLIQNALAAHALDQPGGKLPPGVSMSNVDFYRKHAGDVAKLAAETKDASCGEEDDEDE